MKYLIITLNIIVSLQASSPLQGLDREIDQLYGRFAKADNRDCPDIVSQLIALEKRREIFYSTHKKRRKRKRMKKLHEVCGQAEASSK